MIHAWRILIPPSSELSSPGENEIYRNCPLLSNITLIPRQERIFCFHNLSFLIWDFRCCLTVVPSLIVYCWVEHMVSQKVHKVAAFILSFFRVLSCTCHNKILQLDTSTNKIRVMSPEYLSPEYPGGVFYSSPGKKEVLIHSETPKPCFPCQMI